MAKTRVTQDFVQVLAKPRPKVRVTQDFLQVLGAEPAPQARVTQTFLQVLSSRGAAVNTIPADEIILVAEVNAIDDNGDPVQLLATNSPGWRTGPADTPANTHISPTLDNPGTFRREMFSGNRAFGAVRPSFGAARLLNHDGRYDGWKTYGFDGQAYVLRWGRHGAAYPSTFETLIACTMSAGEVDFDALTLRLRDRLSLLDKPILGETFAGTGGVEGGADLAGTPKQRAFGNPVYVPLQPIVQTSPVVEYTTDGPTYDIAAGFSGKPTASQEILRYRFSRAVTFAAGLAPSYGSARVAATGSWTATLKQNGTSVGTMSFAASGSTMSFTMSAQTTFAEGDILTVIAPASADATLEDIGYTLSGYTGTDAS